MTHSELFPIPPGAMLRLREMTRGDAARFLGTFPGLAPDARDRLLELSLPPDGSSPTVRVQIFDPLRRRFMSAAWLSGASFGQIAALFGITRQSTMQQVDKLLPTHIRQRVPFRPAKLSYDRLAAMRDIFYLTVDIQSLVPEAIAQVLLSRTEDWIDD